MKVKITQRTLSTFIRTLQMAQDWELGKASEVRMARTGGDATLGRTRSRVAKETSENETPNNDISPPPPSTPKLLSGIVDLGSPESSEDESDGSADAKTSSMQPSDGVCTPQSEAALSSATSKYGSPTTAGSAQDVADPTPITLSDREARKLFNDRNAGKDFEQSCYEPLQAVVQLLK